MNKRLRLIVCGLFVCSIFIVGWSSNISKKSVSIVKSIKFNQIKSVEVDFGGKGNETKYYNYNLKNSKEAKEIKDIIKYLHSGRIQGYADEKVTQKGSSPAYLFIELKNKAIISIKKAVGGKVQKFQNGGMMITQFNIPNEVTISVMPDEKPFRILSSELRKKLDNIFK